MTFEEVLKACSNGKMPKVEDRGCVGQVTAIKNGDGYVGISVKFPNTSYNVWFHAEEKKDKRARYMSELNLL